VWAELWREGQSTELFELGQSWLTRAQGNAAWPIVWRKLWRFRPGNPVGLALGCSWLEGRSPLERDDPWFQVYGNILRHLDKDSKLIRQGREWLESDMTHHSWPYMWRGLLSSCADDQDFLKLGSEWLAQADLANRTWAYVWQALWFKRPGDPAMVEMGKQWLGRHADHISWPFVWRFLTSALPGDETLKSLARQWLGEGKSTHKEWASVWIALRTCHPTDPEIVERGRRWLMQVPPDHPYREQIEAACSSSSGRT